MTDFRKRLQGAPLMGLSSFLIDEHIGIYERKVQELRDLVDAYPRVSWVSPPEASGVLEGEVRELLRTPIPELPLSLERGRILSILTALRAETTAKGLAFWPALYLGDDDFWTVDREPTINLPWWLGSDLAWRVTSARGLSWSDDDVLRVLRHEYGHALLYAFEGWKAAGWDEHFGDFEQPYRAAYDPDPARAADFVHNLDRPGPGQLLHYPQKHPDEDWAETFAVWLSGGESQYPSGTGAWAKLRYLGALIAGGGFYGTPLVRARGRRPAKLPGGTVAQYLGVGARDFSHHAALLRREPELLSSVRLHEAYFGALAPGWSPEVSTFAKYAAEAFGSFDSWALDMRAIGGSTSGWGLTVWDPVERRVRNALVRGDAEGVPPGCEILIAMDVHEHAYAPQVGAAKHLYLAAWFANVEWPAVDDRLRVARAAGLLPPNHQFGMRVPQGGSSCSNCAFVSADGTRCGNDLFVVWQGGPVLPAPAERYCCDVFEPAARAEEGP